MPASPQEVWQSSTNPDVITISDFTPGIQRFSRGSYLPTYSSNSPLGSAATAYRCYAVPGVGLCPFPSYLTTTLTSETSSANGSWIGMCGIRSMGLLTAMNTEQLVITNMRYDGTTTFFGINTATAQGTAISAISNKYASSQAGNQTFQTPNIVNYFVALNGTQVFTMDPLNNSITSQTLVEYTGGSGGTVTFDVFGINFYDLSKLMAQSSRLMIMMVQSLTGVGLGNEAATYYITDPPQASAFTFNNIVNYYEPSQVLAVGSWGSIDSGECFVIGQSGGAIYITGDVLAPSSVVKLPGVNPTGAIIGPAALSEAGYIYPSETGAYLWNGGNTSQKINLQIPDDVLWRTAGFTFNPVPAQRPCLTHHDVWGDWVMFANNWCYSTTTSSWWQVEDPAIAQMQLHAPSALSPRFFFSTQDYVINSSGGAETIALALYSWDRNIPATSYTWTSNPIPPSTTGFLTTLNNVEIIASNPSTTSSTIIVNPTIPAGQTPFPGNNPQPVTFTIPATTSNYRASLPLGFTDYNIQINIQAQNTVSPNEAPILHSVNLGYANTRTSGVSP
jgi:hypothetical protein